MVMVLPTFSNAHRVILTIAASISLAVILVFAVQVVHQPFYDLGLAIAPDDHGYRVYQVVPDSPASRAGLVRGDRITSIDGRALEELFQLVRESLPAYLRKTSSLFSGTHVLRTGDLHHGELVLSPPGPGDRPFIRRLLVAERVVLTNIIAGILIVLVGTWFSLRAFQEPRCSSSGAIITYFLFCISAGPAIAMSYFHSLWSWSLLNNAFTAMTLFAISAAMSLVAFALAFPRVAGPRVGRTIPVLGIFPVVYGFLVASRRVELLGNSRFFVHAFLISCAVSFVLILMYQYRTVDSGAGRRLRWIFLGAFVGVAPFLVYLAGLLFQFSHVEQVNSGVFAQITTFFLILLPLSMGIGLTRHTILDVDNLLTEAVTAAVVGTAMAAVVALLDGLTRATDRRVFYLLLVLTVSVAGKTVYTAARARAENWFLRRSVRTKTALEILVDDLQSVLTVDAILDLVCRFVERAYAPQWYTVVNKEENHLERSGGYLPEGVSDGEQHCPSPASDDPVRIRGDHRITVLFSGHGSFSDTGNGGTVGYCLCVGPRSDGDIYSRADQAILRDLAHRVTRRLHVVMHEDTIRKSLETKRALTADKEELLREVHHRVKNNLQIIISLLNLQQLKTAAGETRSHLLRARDRMYAMAMVHETSYQNSDLGSLRITDYFNSIISGIHPGNEPGKPMIRFQTDLEDRSLPISMALPCGLILSELTANAIRHSVDEYTAQEEEITILVRFSYEPTDNMLELSVSDSGPGLKDPDIVNAGSTGGFMVVNAMAGQIGGKLYYESSPFSTFLVRFPVPHSRDPELFSKPKTKAPVTPYSTDQRSSIV